MDAQDRYGSDFFKGQQDGSKRSAEIIVPMVVQLLRPRSVVDVGCGTGAWLSVFSKLGISEYTGIDGEYVDPSMLQIPEFAFRSADLSQPLTAEIQGTYDLAVSLEVGEHLCADRADVYIRSLTRLADVVLFSAAIPYQGGRHHINEQWPDYWARLFRSEGYVCFDCIRERVWFNDQVQWWYAQNTLLYVRETSVSRYPGLAGMTPQPPESLPKVHPRLYMLLANDYFGVDGYRDGLILRPNFTPRL
jgi:SAM-dependent methyltransferase